MAGIHTRFYLDRQHRKISGVCAGIANYFGVDLTLVRIASVAALFVGGPLTLCAYLIMAASAPDRPRSLDEHDPAEKKFWQSVRTNPRKTARSVRARFREIDRRLADTETYLTSPDSRLAREIDSLR